MKKRFFVYLLLVFVLIFLIFFLKNNYKKCKYGNNYFDKSVKGIEEYILNMHSYRATIEVTVTSNKNNNRYLINQEYSDNKKIQTITEPQNIAGVTVEARDGKVEIRNTKLNLSEIYNEYPGVSENVLWLDSFVNSYINSDSKRIYEENDCIVMEVKDQNNRYYFFKKLYVDKQTGLPKKMVVQDNDNNEKIYILYKEIILNR